MSTPEGRVLRACLDYLALCGIFHFRNNTGGTPLHDGSGRYRPAPKSSVGSPDIVAIAPSRRVEFEEVEESGGLRYEYSYETSLWAKPIFIECKSQNGKQSPAQAEFQRKTEAAGGLYLLVRSVDELRNGLRDAGVEVK